MDVPSTIYFQHSTPNSSFQDNSFNNSFNTSNKKKTPKNSDERRGVERFRRVRDEEIRVDPRVQDNSFEAKVSVLKLVNSNSKKRQIKKEKEKCNFGHFLIKGKRDYLKV